MSRYRQRVSAFFSSNIKRMKDSILHIFFSSSYHRCNSKEKLRANDSYDYPHKDEGEATCPSVECNAIGCARAVYCTDTAYQANNANKNHYQTDNNGDIPKYIEELGRAVKFFKKIVHDYYVLTIRKVSDFAWIGCD